MQLLKLISHKGGDDMKSISNLNIADSMKLLLLISVLAIILIGVAGFYCIYKQGKLIKNMSTFNLPITLLI